MSEHDNHLLQEIVSKTNQMKKLQEFTFKNKFKKI